MNFSCLYGYMLKRLNIFFALMLTWPICAQETALPSDFRQHNLTQNNSSLLSPFFSLDRNDPQSIAIWSRWQWQSVDPDPTTLFVNYTRKLTASSAAGIGFLQHNTGVFLQTGGVLNYAYAWDINPDFQIALGLNIVGYIQELSDSRFQPNPIIGLPFLNEENNFIAQAAPSVQFLYQGFSIGFAGENMFDYNFTTKEKASLPENKIYLGLASYQFPIYGGGILENSVLRPTVYFKTIPNLDNQYGFTTLLSAERFWLQAGYNNFYGISGGIGGKFFKNLSLGAVVEVGTSSDLNGKDPSFELATAYHFGSTDLRKKVVGFDPDEEMAMPEPEEEKIVEVAIDQEEKKEEKLTRKERKKLELAKAARTRDSLALAEKERIEGVSSKREEEIRIQNAQKAKDSLEAVKIREAEAVKKAEAAEKFEELEKPKKGERFEEAVLTEDIRPGYYLIINIFATQRYYNSFMKQLTVKGLSPKSFYRTQRKHNYVYLERYDTMQEAREARDSKFFGRYSDTIWIFRVKAE